MFRIVIIVVLAAALWAVVTRPQETVGARFAGLTMPRIAVADLLADPAGFEGRMVTVTGQVIDRITVMSSAHHSPSFGNMELISIPLRPHLRNSNGLGNTLPLLLNWVRSTVTGMGLPAYFFSIGFGSNESTCDTPPDM